VEVQLTSAKGVGSPRTPGEDESNAVAAATQYGRVASIYEAGARWGSGGRIPECRNYHLSLLSRPSTILYPGPGCGTDVALAAMAGHRATVVELSPAMMEKARAHFREAAVDDKIECIQANILDHDRPSHYEVVVGSYFLDVFSPEVAKRVLSHLVRQLKPDGLIVLAGYAPEHGTLAHRLVQRINHLYANVFCKLVVNNARHDIYDYASFYDEMGLTAVTQKDFPLFGDFGPRFHRVWAARKTR
jgi:SAM-dependent methyltransferase